MLLLQFTSVKFFAIFFLKELFTISLLNIYPYIFVLL